MGPEEQSSGPTRDHGDMENARVLAVAHRGDPYRHRENTLPSLRSAVLAGADAVEIDVRATRDGVPVLLHDTTLKRLWGLDRAVDTTNADQVRGLGVPTLRESLDTLTGGPGECRAMVDLMDRAGARAAVAEIREAGAGDRVLYCGHATPMLAVRHHDSAAEIALTWKRALPPPAGLLAELRPRWLNLPFGIVDAELVAQAHRDGLLVGAWTVDLPRNMARLLRAGVDAVTSNRIGTLRQVLDRHGHVRNGQASAASAAASAGG